MDKEGMMLNKSWMSKRNKQMIEENTQLAPLAINGEEAYCSIILSASTVENLRDLSMSDRHNSHTYDRIISDLLAIY
jgi:hypothetical protein